jgi:hypothetical protein
MSFDSLMHLLQGRMGFYWDFQPPAISVLFGLLDRIYPGPFLMLCLDVALIVIGTAGIVFQTRGSVALGVFTLIFTVMYPVTLLSIGVIWRDIIGLGVLLVSIWFLLLYADPNRSAWTRRTYAVLCLLATTAGLLLKANTAASVWLVVAGLCYCALPKTWGRRRLAAAVAGAFTMVVIGTLGASAVSQRIIDEKVYFSQVPLNHHLAQLSVAVGENLFPLQQYPAVTLDELRKLNQRLPEPSQLYGFFFGVYYQRLENMFPRLASDDFDALRA